MHKLFIFSLLVTAKLLSAQPYIEDIQKFKRMDSISMPTPGAVLFVGSSSFTNWVDVQKSFPQHKIVNRAFGGSCITDLIRYFDEIILPYRPRHIVIYCGENDLASTDSLTGLHVFERFRTLYLMILSTYPDATVSYVSMKPSPSRWHLKDKYDVGNEKIKYLCDNTKNMSFIDIRPVMITKAGLPDDSIFLEDKLHMNDLGYMRWQKIIAPYLK